MRFGRYAIRADIASANPKSRAPGSGSPPSKNERYRSGQKKRRRSARAYAIMHEGLMASARPPSEPADVRGRRRRRPAAKQYTLKREPAHHRRPQKRIGNATRLLSAQPTGDQNKEEVPDGNLCSSKWHPNKSPFLL
jgi:hypothetical protein